MEDLKNIELLLDIRNWLRLGAPETAEGFRFRMDAWIAVRTTPFGGWTGISVDLAGAAPLFGDFRFLENMITPSLIGFATNEPYVLAAAVEPVAAELLGLDETTARQLFVPWEFPEWSDMNRRVSPFHTARVGSPPGTRPRPVNWRVNRPIPGCGWSMKATSGPTPTSPASMRWARRCTAPAPT